MPTHMVLNWLAEVSVSDPSVLESLLSASEYEALIAQ